MKIILRLLVVPFVFAIILITHLYHTVKRTYLFIRYGGELIGYEEKDTKITIQDIYYELRNESLTARIKRNLE